MALGSLRSHFVNGTRLPSVAFCMLILRTPPRDGGGFEVAGNIIQLLFPKPSRGGGGFTHAGNIMQALYKPRKPSVKSK